ncbi:MAG: tetratricopeptide repeat protein [Myxococcaceae bacterium]|nr:tetratricopeptide repeat protein [Myxococcaceae bacterium]
MLGEFESSGKCSFLPGQGIVDGVLEGDVFVGRIFLCQTGTACEDRFYPVMAFVDPDEGTFSALVRLETACSSPVLEDNSRLLTLTRIEGDGPGPVVTPGQDRKAQERARRAYKLAEAAVLQARPDYVTAKMRAQESISFDRNNFAAHLLLGVAEMKLGNADAAITAYRQSLALRDDYPLTHYDLACAYARLKNRSAAMQSLRRAVELGLAENDITVDLDLNTLFAGDPEFKALQAKVAQRAAQRRKR